MIRRSLLVVAAVCALAGSGASARQSVDDLIAKNLEAKGGLEKLKAIQSIKQVNAFNMQGMEGSMTIFTKRPNRLRQEMTMGGQTVINAFDGVTPWTINPLVGMNRAVAVTGPQADMVREQGDFDGPLVDYKAKGYTIELAGVETLGERKVHHLRMVSASRQVVHLYLDASTGLEAKRMTEVDTLKLEQEFSDFRTIEGVTLPFHVRLLTNGVPQSEFTVKSVEFNVPMDDAIFRMPKGY
jgi:hypothetical protein